MSKEHISSRSASITSLKDDLKKKASLIEEELSKLLAFKEGGAKRLNEAMRYAVLGGGKRMRGYLSIVSAHLFEQPINRSIRLAASVEMLHAYSLIHDDLPAMDDDDLRRGQPSTHKQFDDATAILAGDALQTLAFATLADVHTHPDSNVRIELIQNLAQASGDMGMVGGQALDMEGEQRKLNLSEVAHVHALKTGCLIRHSVMSGAILGQAPDDLRKRLYVYGTNIGAAFQVMDDVLDVTSSAEELGKTAGKDEHAGKSTFVTLLGVEKAKKEAEKLINDAISALEPFGTRAEMLVELAHYVMQRKN